MEVNIITRTPRIVTSRFTGKIPHRIWRVHVDPADQTTRVSPRGLPSWHYTQHFIDRARCARTIAIRTHWRAVLAVKQQCHEVHEVGAAALHPRSSPASRMFDLYRWLMRSQPFRWSSAGLIRRVMPTSISSAPHHCAAECIENRAQAQYTQEHDLQHATQVLGNVQGEHTAHDEYDGVRFPLDV